MKLHSELYRIIGPILVLMLDIFLAFMMICYYTVHLEKQNEYAMGNSINLLVLTYAKTT